MSTTPATEKKATAPSVTQTIGLRVQPARTEKLVRDKLNPPAVAQAKEDANAAVKAAVAAGNAAQIEAAKANLKEASADSKRMKEGVRIVFSALVQHVAQRTLLAAAERVRQHHRKNVPPTAVHEAINAPDFECAFLLKDLPSVRNYSEESYAERRAKRAAETKAKRLEKQAEKAPEGKGKAADPAPAKDIVFEDPTAAGDGAADDNDESEGARAHPYANSIRVIQKEIRERFAATYGEEGKNFRFEGFTTEMLDEVCRELVERMTVSALHLFQLNRNHTFAPEHVEIIIRARAAHYGCEQQGDAIVEIVNKYLARFQEHRAAEKARHEAAAEKKLKEMTPEEKAAHDAKLKEAENAKLKAKVEKSRAAAQKMKARLTEAQQAEAALKAQGIPV